MALSQFFQFDEANFVNGQARVLFSPLDGVTDPVPVPTTIADIFSMVSPYEAVASSSAGTWYDVGGTDAPPAYTFTPSFNEWKVQQQIMAVELVPTEAIRKVKFEAVEFARSDLLQMFENAGAPTSVAAVTGASAQEAIAFGQFSDINQYRVAVAAFLTAEGGLVTEGTGGPTRPRLVVQVFNRCSVDTGGNIDYSLGNMVKLPLELKLYPEPGAPQNQEAGVYFIEEAGVIAVA